MGWYPPKYLKMLIFIRKTPWLLGTTIVGNPHLRSITPLPFSEGDWIPSLEASSPPVVCRSDTDGLTHYSVLPPMGTQALSDVADWKTCLLGGTCGDRIKWQKNHSLSWGTHPKTNIDTQKWWFPIGISHCWGSIFRCHVSFRGVYTARNWTPPLHNSNHMPYAMVVCCVITLKPTQKRFLWKSSVLIHCIFPDISPISAQVMPPSMTYKHIRWRHLNMWGAGLGNPWRR